MDVEELAGTLMGLAKGSVSEEEALKKVKKATPNEISEAEQILLDRGLERSELQEFCKVHLKAVREKVEEIKEELEEGHPIKTMILEHEEILDSLDELEELKDELGDMDDEIKERLQKNAEHLVEAEKHHEREEETIFPRMREKGITGPPRMMEDDHEKIWPKKKRLKELSEEPGENIEEIKELIDFLGLNLRDHIFKENNILYPSALKQIDGWDKIKRECDDIGYCCFTPSE